MDYKSKYLKYKEKYIRLKGENTPSNILKGGSTLTIPSKFPGTYSFLFMPLLYYTLEYTSVTLPDRFIELFLECVNNAREMLGISLPFTTFDEFIGHLRQSLNSYKINTIADLEALKDGDHHISGNNQERITNYRNDTSVETVISCLALMCIEKLQGKKFIYNR